MLPEFFVAQVIEALLRSVIDSLYPRLYDRDTSENISLVMLAKGWNRDNIDSVSIFSNHIDCRGN